MGVRKGERGTNRPKDRPLWPHEVEPGRSVVNDWDRELFEPWSARKERIARERAVACPSERTEARR